jgi:acyl carrier protein
MVPSVFVPLAELPLTPHGKVDRKALPEPELGTSTDTFVAPRDTVEMQLAKIWSEVLSVEEVGVRDNFFDLGGNSLVALQMLALVKKRFGVAVATVTLFEAPTVHTLAAVLDQQGASAPLTTAPRTTASTTTQPREQGTDRRIAIVGMAGRFPGASTVDEFWANVLAGETGVRRFTDEELDAAGSSREGIDDATWATVRSRAVDQPARTVTEPLRRGEREPDLPKTVVACSFPAAAVEYMSARFAEMADPEWSARELPTGHWPMFSRPADLAALLADLPLRER